MRPLASRSQDVQRTDELRVWPPIERAQLVVPLLRAKSLDPYSRLPRAEAMAGRSPANNRTISRRNSTWQWPTE